MISQYLKVNINSTKKNDLFVKYAENTKKMIQNAADNQSKLLDVINEIFTYVIDPYSTKKVIRINPKLTEDSLQKAIEKTRKFIIELYIKCESDYVNGIKIYEAIVEAKILETTQKQIENLEKQATNIIKETKQTSAPVAALKPVPVPEPVTMPLEPTISPIPTPTPTPTLSAIPVVIAQPPIQNNAVAAGVPLNPTGISTVNV